MKSIARRARLGHLDVRDRALKAIALTAREAYRRQTQQDHDDLTGEHVPAPVETSNSPT